MYHIISLIQAQMNFNLDPLLNNILRDPTPKRQNYAFIRLRISEMWESWVTAAKSLAKKQNLSNRKVKQVGGRIVKLYLYAAGGAGGGGLDGVQDF